MEYGGVAEGEVVFRGKEVEAVCKLLCPDLKYDVSHVQSLKELCKPIKEKLEAVEVSSRFKVKVVGLYGMGGVGKTTISRAICNEMFGAFGGKVCHVELGGKDKVELQRRVLRELTHANALILENSEKLDDLLKQRMNQQEVFLVLDNVWDNEVEEALKYLTTGHHSRSTVVVTSRFVEVLKRLRIDRCSCMEMPNLEEEGAMNLLLHYSDISRRSIVDESDLEIVRRCINICRFPRGEKSTSRDLDEVWPYHPLALRTLGRQLDTKKIKDWDKALEVVDKFNMLKEKVHPVFSVLRLGYDALDEKLKEIFLDLALLWSFKWASNPLNIGGWRGYKNILEWEWLCTLHGVSESDMKANVEAIQRKGLLDEFNDLTKLEFKIHNLYYEFAEAEAHAGPFKKRRILLDKDGCDMPNELDENPKNDSHWPNLKRLIICNSALKSLNLRHCKNVEVLVLVKCVKLEEVDVIGMNKLRLMVVFMCEKGCKFPGLEMLRNLVYFNGHHYDGGTSTQVAPAFSSTKLRVVRLKNVGSPSIESVFPQGLNQCTDLNEVDLGFNIYDFSTKWDGLPHVELGKYLPTSLQKLHVLMHPTLGSSPIHSMAAFTNLQDLNLGGCEGISDLTGLCKLNALQRLNVNCTRISELPRDLINLTHLHYLNMRRCESLTSIVGINHATALRIVLAYNCKELWEVPDDLSSLLHLEVLDLRNASKICRLPEDYEKFVGYPRSDGTLKVRVMGCWGLIVPLVRKLRSSEILQDACEDGCNRGSSESMRSWVVAKKCVDFAAYSLLQGVLSALQRFVSMERTIVQVYWTYLLVDENQVSEVLIRALCEHDICGSRTNRLATVLEEIIWNENDNRHDVVFQWWVVVATAPCTFKAATESILMEPWGKTLLHYTLVKILPHFLYCRMMKMLRNSMEEVEEQGDESNNWFLKTWLYRAMVVVLWKCREKLDDASEQGIDHVRCNEGKKVVNTFLRELEAAKSAEVHHGSVLQVVWLNTGFHLPSVYRYKEVYPYFQFESTLAAHYCCKEIDNEGY